MPGDQSARTFSFSSAGYADGLGRRSVRFDREVGATLEALHLRPELGVFEPVLRDTAARLAELSGERLARCVGFERDAHGLIVLSQLVPGQRLTDILESRPADDFTSGLDAAFGFLAQALPVLGTLHERGLVHGALGPGRVMITPSGRVVLVDAIFGAALARMRPSGLTFTRSLGLLPFIGTPSDPSHDVAQAALSALQIALGRAIQLEPSPNLAAELDEVTEIAQIRSDARLADDVRAFLRAALRLESSSPPGAAAAAEDARRIARQMGSDTGVGALKDLLRSTPIADEPAPPQRKAAPAPKPVAPLRPVAKPVEPPPPARKPEPPPVAPAEDVREFIPAPVQVETPRIDSPSIEVEPAPVMADVAVAPAPPPMPLPVPDPVVAAPAPSIEVTPVAPSVPAEAAPPPVAAQPPAAVPVFVPAPPEPPAPVPAFVPTPVAAEPPAVVPPLIPPPAPVPVYVPPVQAAPPMPSPAPPVLPQPPMPVFPPPANILQPSMQSAQASGQMTVPMAQPVRIKTEKPIGFVPKRTLLDVTPEPDTRALPFVDRTAASESRPFPWKAAAAFVVLIAGLVAGKPYLSGSAEPPPDAKPEPTVVSEPVPPATTGSLNIDSVPSGAMVTIDGAEVGKTPLKLDSVAAGRHLVAITAGETTVKKTVRVEAGKELTVELPVYSGWVALFSPIPLQVAEGGRSLGSSDSTRIMLSPGRHSLVFSNREFGFSMRQTVEIVPGEEHVVNVEPKGPVNVNASPWAEVWVDGTRAGETPLANLPVLLGTREFVFKHPTYGERRVTATVTAAGSAVSVDFTRPGTRP